MTFLAALLGPAGTARGNDWPLSTQGAAEQGATSTSGAAINKAAASRTPTLGRHFRDYATGFGSAKPARVQYGGDRYLLEHFLPRVCVCASAVSYASWLVWPAAR